MYNLYSHSNSYSNSDRACENSIRKVYNSIIVVEGLGTMYVASALAICAG